MLKSDVTPLSTEEIVHRHRWQELMARVAYIFGIVIGWLGLIGSNASAAQISFGISNESSLAISTIELRSQDLADVQPPLVISAAVPIATSQEFTVEAVEGACLFTAVIAFADESRQERADLDLCQFSIVVVE